MRERFQALFDPSLSLWGFLLGTLFLTFITAALWESVTAVAGFLGGWLLIAVVGCCALAWILIPILRNGALGRITIDSERMPAARKGLIVLVSRHPDSARPSIEHHREALEHLWLVATKGEAQEPGSTSVAAQLADEFGSPPVVVHHGSDYCVATDSARDAFDVVGRIFEREASAAGLQADEIIADITGGTKPMTAGMTLACVDHDRDMQYLKSLRLPDGTPDTTVPAVPILIDTGRSIRLTKDDDA